MDPLIPNQQPAPIFTLPDLEGQVHTLSNYLGKIVVVNFWSAECPWAARADSAIQQNRESWGDGVILLSIASNANESSELLRQVAAERGNAPVLLDHQQKVADAYGAQTTPHIFVIDAQGVLRYQGAFNDTTFRQREATHNYLDEAIQALQAGQDPDPARTHPYGCVLVRFPEE